MKLGGFHCTTITHLFGRQFLRDELQLLDDVGCLVEPRLVGEDCGEGRVLARLQGGNSTGKIGFLTFGLKFRRLIRLMVLRFLPAKIELITGLNH